MGRLLGPAHAAHVGRLRHGGRGGGLDDRNVPCAAITATPDQCMHATIAELAQWRAMRTTTTAASANVPPGGRASRRPPSRPARR